MAVNVIVPQLGESVVEATISRWIKKEGDSVFEGDELVELETDKINVVVPAETSGIIQKIAFPEGTIVKPNDVLAEIVPGSKSVAVQSLYDPPWRAR